MAGVERDDPEQVSYFAESDPNAPLPETKRTSSSRPSG